MSSSGIWESSRRRAAGIAFGLAAWGVLSAAQAARAQQEAVRPQEQPPVAELGGLQTLLALEQVLVDTIARNEQSVVAIARVKRQPDNDILGRGQIPDPFGRDLEPSATSASDPSNPDFIPHEFATGVVIDSNGLILTNAHVGRRNPGEPDAEDEIWVTTVDRRPYKVTKVVGADGRMDLAVLKIEASGLTPITLGDASALRKGQIVISLGNPYAIARDGQVSAAWGMISNLARKAGPLKVDANAPAEEKPTLHHYGNLIQTDMRLNLGTSGGPLLNLQGEMIGLITAQAALEGYEQSAGYAIPVNDVFVRAVETLREGKELEFGFLGINPDNLQASEILRGLRGMRIGNVVFGVPAYLSELQPKDVVIAVNGREIFDQDGLMLEIGKLPVAAESELTVLRNGRTETIEVVLGKSPPGGLQIVTAPSPAWRGMRVDHVSVLAGERPSIEAGVAVIEVESQSAAWQAGLRRGMIVTKVEKRRTPTPDEFHQALADLAGEVEVQVAPIDSFGPGLPFLEQDSLPQRFTVAATPN